MIRTTYLASLLCPATLLCLVTACGGSSFSASDTTDAATTDAATTDAAQADAAQADADSSPVDVGPSETGPAGCVATGTGALGVLGCPCSSPASLACTGNAQKVTLICSGGSWIYSQTCASGQLCDTATGPNQGSCVPIDSACTNATPGQNVCGTVTTVVACGPDLVSDSPVTTCTGTTICIDGACAAPPPCPGTTSFACTSIDFDTSTSSCTCPASCICAPVYGQGPGQWYCGFSSPNGFQLCGQ